MTRVKVDAFEDGAEVANNSDVFVRDKTHADGGTWQAPGAGSASAAWPVGSVFISVVATDPATLLGFGTWSAFAAGRVLLGNDGATYPTDEVTGGATSTTHSHSYGSLYTDTIGNHSHAVGSIAAAAESSHTHGGGTIATVAESTHTHGAGSLVPSVHSATTVASHGDHGHYINNVGSDATITAHAQHRHRMQEVLQHSHPQQRASVTTGALTGWTTAFDASCSSPVTDSIRTSSTGTDPAYTNYETQGAHTLGGKTEGIIGGGLTHSVTGPVNHTMSGTSGAGSSHSHGITGSTGAGSSHSHGMSGSTAADGGGHAHNVLGSTGSDATSVMQPYIVVHMWKRTA